MEDKLKLDLTFPSLLREILCRRCSVVVVTGEMVRVPPAAAEVAAALVTAALEP